MKGAIAWFAENSVAANLLMLLIIGGGFLALGSIKQEVFPEVSLDMITITVPYPGAAPEEVEEAVCVRIEEEITEQPIAFEVTLPCFVPFPFEREVRQFNDQSWNNVGCHADNARGPQ